MPSVRGRVVQGGGYSEIVIPVCRVCGKTAIHYSMWRAKDIVGEAGGYWIPAFAGLTSEEQRLV
ncbi:hypothetical protein [Roseibium sp.]|uniref:hypothetical protein n=1 Tax=Roseibium sp. TaxID=1936156 RepID=UPI003B512D09